MRRSLTSSSNFKVGSFECEAGLASDTEIHPNILNIQLVTEEDFFDLDCAGTRLYLLVLLTAAFCAGKAGANISFGSYTM